MPVSSDASIETCDSNLGTSGQSYFSKVEACETVGEDDLPPTQIPNLGDSNSIFFPSAGEDLTEIVFPRPTTSGMKIFFQLMINQLFHSTTDNRVDACIRDVSILCHSFAHFHVTDCIKTYSNIDDVPETDRIRSPANSMAYYTEDDASNDDLLDSSKACKENSLTTVLNYETGDCINELNNASMGEMRQMSRLSSWTMDLYQISLNAEFVMDTIPSQKRKMTKVLYKGSLPVQSGQCKSSLYIDWKVCYFELPSD
jgi:hypothetical protein